MTEQNEPAPTLTPAPSRRPCVIRGVRHLTHIGPVRVHHVDLVRLCQENDLPAVMAHVRLILVAIAIREVLLVASIHVHMVDLRISPLGYLIARRRPMHIHNASAPVHEADARTTCHRPFGLHRDLLNIPSVRCTPRHPVPWRPPGPRQPSVGLRHYSGSWSSSSKTRERICWVRGRSRTIRPFRCRGGRSGSTGGPHARQGRGPW